MKTQVKILLAGIIALLGVGIASVLVMAQRKAPKKELVRDLPAVEVMTAQTGEYTVQVQSQGEVLARRETQLVSQVSGRVLHVSPKFEVGERFEGGEVLVEIDPADYETAKAKAASELADANLVLEQEKALAEQAKLDWEALGEGREASDLVLRKPQLESARARVSAAESALGMAGRDLERTRVKAPYPCSVKAKMTEIGASLGVGAPVAEVFSSGDFELRLPVSLEDYTFVNLKPGVKVTFSAELGGETATWGGELVRTEGQVDRASRSVFLVARVTPGPAGSPMEKFLAPGLFLKADITGETLQGVFRLPRKALYGKDKILMVNPDNTVALRPVKVVRTERNEVVIGGGLEAGERVAVSPVPNVIDGMTVMIAEQKDAEAGDPDSPEPEKS